MRSARTRPGRANFVPIAPVPPAERAARTQRARVVRRATHFDASRLAARVPGMAKLLLPATALFLAAPAAAQYATRDVGAWTVAPSADGAGCFLTRRYDRSGDTTLLLGLEADGTNHLTVLNANWSIKPKDRLKLTFRLSRGGYVDNDAIGLASDGKRGFVTTFEGRFPGYFASSAALAIFKGDVPVERLPLDGSGAAVGELRKCVAAVRASPGKATARDRRPEGIPKDPFARR